LPLIVSLPLCSFPEHARSTTATTDLTLPCVVAGEAGENDIITVDASTPAEPVNQTLAPAYKICDCHRFPRPRLDQFQHSPDLADLGKPLHRETLAGAEPPRTHQPRRGRRPLDVDRILIERPRRRTASSPAPGWPASRLGWIWPRSGEARPDPACFFFFSVLYLFVI
jgi:hypothetical protein